MEGGDCQRVQGQETLSHSKGERGPEDSVRPTERTEGVLPPPPPEEVGSDAVSRRQKRKQEEEGFVGEGSGKDNGFNFTDYLNDSDMEADGE